MSSTSDRSTATSPAEWVLGILGALLAVALLALLGHQTLTRDGGPRLEVVVGDVQETTAGYEVTVRVENSGGETAEGALIAGEVTRDGKVLATGEATVDYVPPDSHRSVTLVVSADPHATGAQLEVSVSGYTTT